MSTIAESPTAAKTATYSLLFVSERDRGRRVALSLNKPLVLGRCAEADCHIDDSLSSRRHAQISVQSGQIVVEDLESTNGTFVNGKKIRRTNVQKGDRILIGTCSLEISDEPAGDSKPLSLADTKPIPLVASVEGNTMYEVRPGGVHSAPAETTMLETARLISGSVKELPITDLLQLITNTRKSGVLTVRHGADVGKVILSDGQICRATINDSAAVDPKRTLYRLLRWQTGTFELRPLDKEPVNITFDETNESLLLEAACQNDELTEMEAKLPRFDASLVLANPLPGPLRNLTEEEMDLCQLVMEHGVVLAVVDNFRGSDRHAFTHLISLIERKFVLVR